MAETNVQDPKAATPAAPAAAGPPKVPGARNDPQARIDELSAQKAHFQEKARKYEDEMRALREEVAFIKGQTTAQPQPATPKASPKTWAEMSDEQLDEVRRRARTESQDDVVDAAYAELARREAERAAKTAVEQSKKHYERQQLLRDTHSRILEDFGQEAFNPESKLYQQADRYISEARRVLGDSVVKDDPLRLYDAFARAERTVRTLPERDRFQQLEQENKELRDRVTLAERGGSPGADVSRPPEGFKEALDRGDKRGAIKKLSIAQNLTNTVRRSLLP